MAERRFSDRAIKFLSAVLRRDQEDRQDVLPKKQRRGQGLRAVAAPSLSQTGDGGIGDQLELNQGLLQRFVDYELMDQYPECSSALDIYADDATQPDSSSGHTLEVETDDDQIRDTLDELLFHRLDMESHIWEIARSLCIAKGGRIWADGKMVQIEDVQPGQRVLGFKDGKPASFEVVRRFDNGTREVFSVRTKHREFFATDDHKVLTQDDDGSYHWRRVKDLRCRRHPGGQQDLKNTKLVISTRALPGRVPSWDELFEFDPFLVEHGAKGSPTALQLPAQINPDFCRLFGFLLGDGFLSGEHQVAFSRGEYPELNDRYDALLRELGLDPVVSDHGDGEASVVNSVQFNRTLKALGFKRGASNKRVPGWVYGLPEEHREALLWGFIDADGWINKPRTWRVEACHFEISNYNLARDLKNLVDGLGFVSGNLRGRQRKAGFKIKNKTVKRVLPSYILTFANRRHEEEILAERVISVTSAGEQEVFDLEVDDEAHNFAVDGVFVHNCKYGNDFEELLIHPTRGVVGLEYISAASVRRMETREDGLIGFVQDPQQTFDITPDECKKILSDEIDVPQNDMAVLHDFQVAHFRLNSVYRQSRYGFGVLEPGRWIWKRLVLLEDAVLVHKLSRAPSRYAFYVDVGKRNAREALKYLNKVKQKLKKRKFVTKEGRLDLKFNPLGFDEDFFIPVIDGQDSARIDVLSGPDFQGMEEAEYFRRKLYAAIKVPAARLGYGETRDARTVLSNDDVQFARSVLRIQRELRNGVKKIGRVHLGALGIDPAEVYFEIYMTIPSGIYEVAQMEIRNARADLAARMREFVSLEWILAEVFGFSDQDINTIKNQRAAEQQAALAVQGAQLAWHDPVGRVLRDQESEYRRLTRRDHRNLRQNFTQLMQEDERLRSRISEIHTMLRDIHRLQPYSLSGGRRNGRIHVNGA